MDRSIFFHGLSPIARTLLVGFIAYISLVALLRLSGKRTIAKMNIFDFVVTVALGSTLANIITTADLDLATGLTSLAVLVGVQYAISWGTSRSRRFERWVNGRPTLLLYRGQCIFPVMKAMRVTEEEVRAAVRMAGLRSFDRVHAVVMETDGVFSVVRAESAGHPVVMSDVSGYPEHLEDPHPL
jgi:uncharacterized membrane protein YcaP (DUF421 family)